VTSCRYPKCRSNDIQIIYLGKPLCSKHWDKIASLPLEKVAGLLKVALPAPRTVKTEDPFELKASLEPAAPAKRKSPVKEATSAQKKAPAKKKTTPGKTAGIRSVADAKRPPPAKSAVSAKRPPPVNTPTEEQQSLFG
jgi:hypothetical protein